MKNFDELNDWLAICDLKARYCRLMDTKQWDAWRELFDEDYELDVSEESGIPPIRGRDAALASVRSFIEHAITAHQVHAPEISIDGDVAQAVWAMQDRVIFPNGLSMTGYGHYHERLVRRDGRWKIAALKLTRLHVDVHSTPKDQAAS
jgi:hypothetical protein